MNVNSAQFIAGIERREIQYPFLQVHDGVPVEHALLLGARWEGETITSVSGLLYNHYAIANERQILTAAARAKPQSKPWQPSQVSIK